MVKITNEEFEKIYKETYLGLLKYIAVRTYDVNDINDILQDTYIEFYRILNKKVKIDNKDAFLYGISKNIIKRYYKKYKKEIKNITFENEKLQNTLEEKIEFDENLINKSNIERVWKIVDDKDSITRKIFYLYYVLDFKIVDIARELEYTESFVKNKIYRTLKEIKNNIGEDVNENE